MLLFLVVALVSSNLAARLRRETETLRQRENEIQHLYEFSRRLAACFSVSDLISAIQNHLSRTLGQQAVFFAATADGRFEAPEAAKLPKVVQTSVTSMIATIRLPARTCGRSEHAGRLAAAGGVLRDGGTRSRLRQYRKRLPRGARDQDTPLRSHP